MCKDSPFLFNLQLFVVLTIINRLNTSNSVSFYLLMSNFAKSKLPTRTMSIKSVPGNWRSPLSFSMSVECAVSIHFLRL